VRLRRVEPPDDERALAALASRRAIRERATTPDRVQLLWEVCALPDYKKLLFEDHVETLARLYADLTSPRGRVDEAWVNRDLSRISTGGDDIETLLYRLAEIRLWSYASNQPGWLDARSAVAERSRSIEDGLSDRLHQLLVARFVAIKKRTSVPKAPPAPGSSPFAALERLRPHVAGAAEDVADIDADKLVERVIEATYERFRVDRAGLVACDGVTVGRLKPGKTLDTPEVVVTLDVEPGARLRLSRRIVAYTRDLAGELGGSLRDLEGLTAAGRGVAHVVARGLGTALTAGAALQLRDLADADRSAFARAGLVFGRAALYLPRLLKPEQVTKRVALAAAFFDTDGRWPSGREVSVARRTSIPEEVYLSVGYVAIAGIAVRADVLERVIGKLVNAEAPPEPAAVASWLSCRPADAERALERLLQLAA
jgi:ATP-dependent RNA helicase SUPV3L1/SUV3